MTLFFNPEALMEQMRRENTHDEEQRLVIIGNGIQTDVDGWKADDNRVWVRDIGGKSESGYNTPSVPYRVLAGVGYTPIINNQVWIQWEKGPKMWRIYMPDPAHAESVGRSMHLENSSDPHNQFHTTEQLLTLKSIPIGGGLANVQGYQFVWSGLYGDYKGTSAVAGTHINLIALQPSTLGEHCYCLAVFSPSRFFDSLNPIVTYLSTPQTGPLDASDIQECVDQMEPDERRIKAYRLDAGAGAADYRGHADDRDLRDWLNEDVPNASITLTKLAPGTPNKYLGFDGSGDPAELNPPTASINLEDDGVPVGTGFTVLDLLGGTVVDEGGGRASIDISGSGSATTTRITGVPNGSFEVWENGIAAAPDAWTVTGSGATIAREDTIVRHGLRSAKLTRVGNDCTFTTDMYARAGATFVRSRAYTVGAWVYATTATRVRLVADDGVTVSYSSYHGGAGAWEWLTIAYTPDAAATQFEIGLSIDGGNTAGYLDAIALAEGSVMTAGYYPGTVPINSLPRRALIDHRFSRVVAGGAIVSGIGSGPQLGGSIKQTPGAINDAFEDNVSLASGTYTLRMFGETFTNRGISHIYIDEVLQGTIDWYSASGVANLYKTLSVTVIGDGDHVLKIVMASKNASGTGYELNVPFMQID